MTQNFTLGDQLPKLVEDICSSYNADPRTQHIDCKYLPSRVNIIQALEMVIELCYPGLWGRQHLTTHNVAYHVGELLPRIGEILQAEVYKSYCYQDEKAELEEVGGTNCEQKSSEVVVAFLKRIPDVRAALADDIQAAFEGDPAAKNTAEVILCYPGILAITVYRIAHELYQLDVPWLPRVMAEWAHGQTGIDIHPGAKIGKRLFIDHGTGVVIGETAEIGDRVKIYQGVTLGAISFPKDERGRLIRGHKRHPTVKDDATLYANAIVLGGETTIGESSVIGGSVFLTSSIPEGCTVTIKTPELTIRKGKGRRKEKAVIEPITLDFQI